MLVFDVLGVRASNSYASRLGVVFIFVVKTNFFYEIRFSKNSCYGNG